MEVSDSHGDREEVGLWGKEYLITALRVTR